LCVCFVEWQKVPDHVNWEKLMQILKEIGIDRQERRLISKLYLDQRVKVQLDRVETRKCEDWNRTVHVAYRCIKEYHTDVTDQQMNTNTIYLLYSIINQHVLVTAAAISRVSHQHTNNFTKRLTKMTQCYS
jgi:hypothetical protein